MMERIAARDPIAFKQCLDMYGSLVWGLARRLSWSAADVEDATQEIFLTIWQSASRFKAERGCERAFIAMLARRRLVDRIRHHYAQPACDSVPLETLDAIAYANGESAAAPEAETDHAVQALTKLRPEYQQVLLLSITQGLSQGEIAAQLSMPLGTVKSNMRRGLLEMRSLLKRTVTPRPRRWQATGTAVNPSRASFHVKALMPGFHLAACEPEPVSPA